MIKNGDRKLAAVGWRFIILFIFTSRFIYYAVIFFGLHFLSAVRNEYVNSVNL